MQWHPTWDVVAAAILAGLGAAALVSGAILRWLARRERRALERLGRP